MFGLSIQCSYHSIPTISRQVRHGCLLWVKTLIYVFPHSLKGCVQYDVILKHSYLTIWRINSMIWIRSRIYIYICVCVCVYRMMIYYIEDSHRTSHRIRCYTYLYTTVGYLVINTKMTDIPSSHCRRHPRWRHVTEALSAFHALCERKPTVSGAFPSQRDSNMNLMFPLLLIRTICWTKNQVVIWAIWTPT